MMTERNSAEKYLQSMPTWLIRGVSTVISPLGFFLQLLSIDSFQIELLPSTKDDKCLAIGRTVLLSYEKYHKSLQDKKQSMLCKLQEERETLCALSREYRQLIWRLQILQYEVDASLTNRQMLMDLLKERLHLNQKNIRLKSDLRLLEFQLQSTESNKINEDEKAMLESSNRNVQNGETVVKNGQSSMDTSSLWDVCCVSTESLDSTITWVTTSELSSCIPPLPD